VGPWQPPHNLHGSRRKHCQLSAGFAFDALSYQGIAIHAYDDFVQPSSPQVA